MCTLGLGICTDAETETDFLLSSLSGYEQPLFKTLTQLCCKCVFGLGCFFFTFYIFINEVNGIDSLYVLVFWQKFCEICTRENFMIFFPSS